MRGRSRGGAALIFMQNTLMVPICEDVGSWIFDDNDKYIPLKYIEFHLNFLPGYEYDTLVCFYKCSYCKKVMAPFWGIREQLKNADIPEYVMKELYEHAQVMSEKH